MANQNAVELRKLRIVPDAEEDQRRRDPFQRDYGRLIHSPAFRRLQGKSQVFGAGTGDYYRTRLTHSLEVAQIARSVAQRLYDKNKGFREEGKAAFIIDPTVVECASLAHDLGHPPFGHKGEEVLNNILKSKGMHYEGNAQNFRILMFLEKNPSPGLNLTSAVLLAVNKYPYKGNIALDENGEILDKYMLKGLYEDEWKEVDKIRQTWGLQEGQRTLEAQLMDLCDDIAYSTHDIEDGIRANKIHMLSPFTSDERLMNEVVKEIKKQKDTMWDEVRDNLESYVGDFFESYYRKWDELFRNHGRDKSYARRELKAYWVNEFANKVDILASDDGYKKVTFVTDGQEDLELMRKMVILKKLAWVTLVKDLRVQRLQKRSEVIVKGLWEAFQDSQKALDLFPYDWIKRFQATQSWSAEQEGKVAWERFVVDYIAGMTDAYAEKVYSELYGSKSGTIYELD